MWRYIAGFLTIWGLFSGCKEASTPTEAEEETPRAYPVRVVPVQRGDLKESVDAVGTLAFERQVKIRAQVAGVVHEIGAAEGADVRGGEVLTRIIAPEMKARLDQIDAELRRAEAERDYVCSNHETDKRLGDAGALEVARVDISRKGCATATEAVRGIQARHSEVRTGLAKLVEKAPESGVLLEWTVEPGEFVGPGQPLAVLGAGKRLVVILLPEVDVQRGIAIGAPVTFKVGDTLVESEVSFISPLARGPARSVRVEIPWPEGLEAAPAGSSIDVSVVIRSVTAHALVPAEAVFVEGESHWVATVVDGKSQRTKVEPVLRSSGRIALDPSFQAQKVVVSKPSAVPDATALFVVEAL